MSDPDPRPQDRLHLFFSRQVPLTTVASRTHRAGPSRVGAKLVPLFSLSFVYLKLGPEVWTRLFRRIYALGHSSQFTSSIRDKRQHHGQVAYKIVYRSDVHMLYYSYCQVVKGAILLH